MNKWQLELVAIHRDITYRHEYMYLEDGSRKWRWRKVKTKINQTKPWDHEIDLNVELANV
jgi:hypothetical protein